MALIKCPECDKQISDKAINCPQCGFPISVVPMTPTAPAEKTRQPRLKKRADKRLQKNIYIGINPETGSRKFKTVYGHSKSELETNASEVIAHLSKGTYADDKGHTVASWGNVWLDIYVKGNVANNTYYGYKNIIKNHISDIADIRLKKLTKTDVQSTINKLSGHYDLQRRVKLTLNQMFEVAIEDGLVYKNVCRNISLPKKPKTNKRALTDLELKAIDKSVFTMKQKAFVYLLLYTGMRRGEILALKKSDIDLKNNLIHVVNAVEFESEKASLKLTKTIAGERAIDILEPLKPVITSYLSEIDTFFLFTNTKGELMSKTSYRRFWDGIFRIINESAGGKCHYEKDDKETKQKKKKLIYDINAIPGLTPHIFRHNYATMLYYAKVDIKDAQRLLGHADSKTTIDIYTHLDKQKSGSKNKLDDYILKTINE
jgi:integrase/DNA-directed RNA polymerase subunit RPC12/RpoP